MADGDQVTEEAFSQEVLAFFRLRLAKSRFAGRVEAAEKVKVLKDLTVGNVDGTWRLVAGVQQQDVVFYCPTDSFDYRDFKSKAMLDIKKYRGRRIHVPLAICELKTGDKNMNTHVMITYSSIAEQLKTVFPHCQYHFVMRTNARSFTQETFLRHCKGFNRVFTEWSRDRDEVWFTIRQHLEWLERNGMISKPVGRGERRVASAG